MRRLTAWVGGVAGGVTAYRWWRRRPRGAAEPSPEPLPEPPRTETDERAEELRAKLAETRESDEPAPVEPGEPPEAVEERRQRVHDEARSALDEMKPEAGERKQHGAAPESN